jgi:type I restriction-modification system DNA methylase subunit
MCIEPYGQLQTQAEAGDVYMHLLNHFRLAESKYDSGIFDFDADMITGTLMIDDKVLKTIIQDLYYPKSPYEFSVLGVEILGNVYEQFLGKVIRLTAGHQAKVETKPEVKKAGGVYYTPQYIVEYIVENTVGKLIAGKTPEEIAHIKILDPACGSGSFLIGAYSYLLRYHLDWYVNNKPKKHKEAVFQVKANEWYLTTAEKKRILLDNIFGVDIDSQAVEVTKMSLLLKVLEHESGESIDNQAKLGLEGVLPNLGDNIKCGNSLIGPDYYDTVQANLFNEEEMRRVNVFDWEDDKKGFGGIMKRGGFDCVVGNPPYVSIESTRKDVTEFYLKTYKSAYGRVNTFSLFIEKAISLLKKNGNCGLIISNRILTNTQLTPLRKLLLENCEIKSILSFKKSVFGVAVDTAVITFQRKTPSQEQTIEIWYNIIDLVREKFEVNTVLQSTFLENQSYVFNVKQMEKFKKLIQKVREKSIPLEKVCDVKDGIILGAIKDLLLSDNAVDDRYEKWLDGGEVARYSIEWSGRYILYTPSLVEEELKRKQKKAKETAETPSDFKKLSRPGIWLRSPEIFKQPKILTRQNAKRLIGVLDEDNYFVKNSLHCTLLKDKTYNLKYLLLHCTLLKDKTYNLKYLLGLINSKAMDFYFQEQVGSTGEIFSQMKITYLKKLPIRTIDFSNPTEKALHDKLVALVENMLELQKKYHETRLERDKELYERQIRIIDAQIDRLVYDLYGLTEEEIKVIEGMER